MAKHEKPKKKILESWHSDPKNWKWSYFYYNKSDSRILLPKRINQLGWTFNFANPIAYTFIIICILLIIAIIIYSSLNTLPKE
ncbi:MAG: hypothetical protein IPO86_12035 [Saprospiraceae bacterium]|nr:hypothetical protein [Saprospiraceae bacterium]